MSVQPVTSNRPATHQQIEMNLRTTTTGLSSVSSTITSASGASTTAPAASSGFLVGPATYGAAVRRYCL